MARYSGRRISIGIAKEAVRGTLEGTADYWLPHAEFNAMETLQKVRDDSGFGVIETPTQSDIVKETMEGDLEMNIRDDSIGLLLLALFGTETFSADDPEAGVGTHTFTVAETNQHQSLTVFENNPVRQVASAGCMVNSASFEVVLDQYIRASFSLIGEKFDTYSNSAAYTAETKFRPQDVSIKFAAAVANLGAASAVSTIRRFALEFNKNVEDFQGLGSVTPVDFLNKDFNLSGEVEILFEDETYLNYALNNTYRAIRLTMTNTGVTIGAATNPSLQFDLSQVDFDEPDIDKGRENIGVLTLPFTAHYKLGETDMVEAQLINDVNSAY